MKLIPKNWHEFQHYKNRNPPWIKLHKNILDDYDWWKLSVASRALAPCLWLLASCYDDGIFDAALNVLSFRFRMTEKEVEVALNPLIDKGYFIIASNTLADCKQVAMPEKRREEKNKPYTSDFEMFWLHYPIKEGKKVAFDKWVIKKPPIEKVIQSIARQKTTEKWRNGFIPMPATYINQERWEDEFPQIVQKPRRVAL